MGLTCGEVEVLAVEMGTTLTPLAVEVSAVDVVGGGDELDVVGSALALGAAETSDIKSVSAGVTTSAVSYTTSSAETLS